MYNKQKNRLLTLFLVMSLLLIKPVFGQTGLIQHLDANVEASIISGADNAISAWQDQTTNQNNASITSGSISKKQENELTWLNFGPDRNVMELFSGESSDSWLDQSAGTGGFCVLISYKPSKILDKWNDIIGNSSATSDGFGMRYSSTGGIQAYIGGKSIAGASIEVGKAIVMVFNYNATDGSYKLWDSKSKSTVTGTVAGADFSMADPVSLGSTNNTARYFIGYVGEVKIYNKSLSDEEFESEQESLYLKWVIADSEKDPPTPNPASFAIVPEGVCGTIISMTAIVAYDISEPLEYMFTETSGNPGGSSSDWQTNPNYRDGDLSPETSYSYTVTIRDANGNEGKASESLSASTATFQQPGLENELEYGAYYGYQGWHFATGDGRVNANDWVHWFESGTADAEHIHGDMWPDLREYDSENLYETQMLYPDGKIAKLYSCFDYSTIDLHIKWMSEYGIKGCAVQRFTSSIDSPNKLEQGDKKVRDIMTACEKYGVKFWIMHDSGQGDENEYERITNDWKHLVEDLDILQSPAYTWQNGLPVYGLWGVGVSSRSWTPEEATKLISFYHDGEEKYRTYICAGVPVIWRTDPPEGWSPVFESLDMISPWRTIFNGPDKYKSRMQEDLAYCTEKGIDYNPVISPGASTLHLRDSEEMRNWKPRNGGHFLWKQAYEVCNMGSKFMYIAMFDEVDEGTAMYKLEETADNMPIGAKQVPLNEDGYDLPSDWYLQVGTEIQKMIEGTISVTSEMPLTPELVSVKITPNNNEIKLYPVPAQDKLYISAMDMECRYTLMNLQGVIVSEGKLLSPSIDVSQLSSGMYFLQLNGTVVSFIKQ